MTSKIETLIQCHGNSAGEVWECSMVKDDIRIAFVTGLASHHKAKQAAEYLRFGLSTEWRTAPMIDPCILDAGVMAVNEWVDPEDDTREVDLVTCVWNATVGAWTRKMIDQQNGGEECK
jgi:hypothetical protein